MEHSKHMRLGMGGRFPSLAAKTKKKETKMPKMAQAGKKRKRFSKADFKKKY